MIRCIETRVKANGWRRRRYEYDDGRRFTTMEVPFELGMVIARVQAIAAAKGMSENEWLTKVENGLRQGGDFTPPIHAMSPRRRRQPADPA